MKKQSKILLAVLAVLVVGALVFASTNSTLFQGKLSPLAQGTKAFTLVDSALLDNDFDGVTFPTDQCPNIPAHQIVRFGPKDYTSYLGQQIKLDYVDQGLTMTFDVNGKSYGVSVGQGTYVKPTTKKYPGFSIRGLFAMYSPGGTNDEAIVVISRTDSNVGTGCN